jgi:hypothetical protein
MQAADRLAAIVYYVSDVRTRIFWTGQKLHMLRDPIAKHFF